MEECFENHFNDCYNTRSAEKHQTLTAVMNLVPWGWRSSSLGNIEGGVTEDEGVEVQRKEEGSLLLYESMTMLGCPGMVWVLSPVTLSLELHWEEVSELSVTVI